MRSEGQDGRYSLQDGFQRIAATTATAASAATGLAEKGVSSGLFELGKISEEAERSELPLTPLPALNLPSSKIIRDTGVRFSPPIHITSAYYGPDLIVNWMPIVRT